MKYRLFLLSTFLAFAFAAKSQINISTRATKDATAGDTLEVVMQVNKPDVQGFGSLMQTLPSGWVLTKVDCGDGEYKTQGNILNISWLRMPSDANFTIKYYLASQVKDSAESRITGDFTWVQAGKRGKKAIDPIVFKLKAKKYKIGIRPLLIFPENHDTVKIEREKVETDSKKRIHVLLKIYKSAYNGSAEIRESIPKGYKMVSQSKTVAFRTEADSAYFSWAKMPVEPFISLMYILAPTGEKQEKDPIIGGRLIFKDKRKSIDVFGYAVKTQQKADANSGEKTKKNKAVIDDSKLNSEPVEDIFKVLGKTR